MWFRIVTLLLLCLSPIPLIGQEKESSITAQVLSNKVAAGEIGVLMVKIRNGDASLPERIETEGLDILSTGQSVSMSVDALGGQIMDVTYSYRFRGEKPGTYTIPSLTATIRGKEYTTNPIEVTIVKLDPNDHASNATKQYFGKLQVSKTEAYVNEAVPFQMAAYVRGKNAIVKVIAPLTEIKHDNFVFQPFQRWDTSGEEVGNNYFSVSTIQSTLFALKPGEHEIGPAQIGVEAIASSSTFGGFGIFQRTANRELATNTVRMKVKPLPDGAPASFTGGVGDFEMNVTPSTTQLNLGDPVSMEFEITGAGNFTTMSAPSFASPQKGIWKTYEPSKEVSEGDSANGSVEGKATFSQVIIPEKKTDAIPAFEFTFFNPATGAYVTRTSDPIPISVNVDSGSGQPVATSKPTSPQSSTDYPAESPSPEFNDVLYIRTATPQWLSQAPSGAPGILFYVFQTVFSIAFCTVVGFGVSRMIRRYQSEKPSRDAVLTFRQSLKNVPGAGSSKKEFFQAVATSLLLWKKEHPKAPGEVNEVIDRVSEKCESILYGGVEELESRISAMEAAEYHSILSKLPRR